MSNRREFLKRVGYIGLGVGGMGALLVLNDKSIRQDEDAKRAYQRRLAETPVPEKMLEMDTFTDEMQALYPGYNLSLEHIRTGRYHDVNQTFDIDRYHLVFNLEPETQPDELLQELEGLYMFVRKANLNNGTIDLIGISEQARRFHQEEWAQDRPLVIPERTPEAFVGIAFKGVVRDTERFQIVMIDELQLNTVNALPQNRSIYTNDNFYRPKTPLLFDAAARVEAPSVYNL